MSVPVLRYHRRTRLAGERARRPRWRRAITAAFPRRADGDRAEFARDFRRERTNARDVTIPARHETARKRTLSRILQNIGRGIPRRRVVTM